MCDEHNIDIEMKNTELMVVMEPMVPMEIMGKVKNKLGSSYGRKGNKIFFGYSPGLYRYFVRILS